MTFFYKKNALYFLPFMISLLFLGCTQVDSNQNLPEDNATITLQRSEPWIDPIPDLKWQFRHEEIMFQEDEKVPNFTLHTPEGIPFNLYSELGKGKPVLLLSGSQTCQIARRNLNPINDVVREYGNDLTVAMVYTIEAHPFDTVSPFSIANEIWLTRSNFQEDIYIKQQRTYKERKEATELWREESNLEPIMLVDNPDNDFWRTFGQATNMAYLIDTDTTVFWRQAYLMPRMLHKEINHLLNE